MFKYLYFANSLTDAVCMPTDLLTAMVTDGESDGITFKFKDVQDGIGTEITIKVKTKTNKNKEVMDAVTDVIRTSKRPFIVIADEVNNEFIHRDLTELESSNPQLND